MYITPIAQTLVDAVTLDESASFATDALQSAADEAASMQDAATTLFAKIDYQAAEQLLADAISTSVAADTTSIELLVTVDGETLEVAATTLLSDLGNELLLAENLLDDESFAVQAENTQRSPEAVVARVDEVARIEQRADVHAEALRDVREAALQIEDDLRFFAPDPVTPRSIVARPLESMEPVPQREEAKPESFVRHVVVESEPERLAAESILAYEELAVLEEVQRRRPPLHQDEDPAFEATVTGLVGFFLREQYERLTPYTSPPRRSAEPRKTSAKPDLEPLAKIAALSAFTDADATAQKRRQRERDAAWAQASGLGLPLVPFALSEDECTYAADDDGENDEEGMRVPGTFYRVRRRSRRDADGRGQSGAKSGLKKRRRSPKNDDVDDALALLDDLAKIE